MPRQKAPIDPEALEKLAGLQCTVSEAAAFLEVAQSTLSTRMKTDKLLADAWERGRELGKVSLRRSQWEAAKSGDRTMLIWLGKQWLGQRDRMEQDVKSDTAVRFIAEWGTPASVEVAAAEAVAEIEAVAEEEE